MKKQLEDAVFPFFYGKENLNFLFHKKGGFFQYKKPERVFVFVDAKAHRSKVAMSGGE